MRRFELGDRFWEAGLVGSDVLSVRWGTRGATPQTLQRTFASLREAQRKLDEYIAARTAEGFVEVKVRRAVATPARPTSPSAARWWGRFESSSQFLELTLDGARVRQIRGPLGEPAEVDGESEQASADAARELVQRTVKAALATGFQLVREGETPQGEPPRVASPPRVKLATIARATNLDLEQQCRASLDDPTPWTIYADWLIENGDPCGPLAALRLAGKDREADRYVVDHKRQLFGQQAEHGRRVSTLTWRHGFVTGIALRKPDPAAGLSIDEMLRELLPLPILRFVESLRFGLVAHGSDNDWSDTMDVITAAPQAPHVRELRFDDHEGVTGRVAFGDFSGAWPKLPALERLHIKAGAGGTLGPLHVPRLRTLVRESTNLGTDELAEILDGELPMLEHLGLWFGTRVDGAASVARILEWTRWPALVDLGLNACEDAAAWLPVLAASTVLPSLRRLELTAGTLRSAHVSVLRELAPALRHLEAIDISDNPLDPFERGELARVLPNVRWTERSTRVYDPDDDEDEDVYDAAGE